MLATTINKVSAFYVRNHTTNLHTTKLSMCGAASSLSIYSQRKDVKQIQSSLFNSIEVFQPFIIELTNIELLKRLGIDINYISHESNVR